ncbi:hypothetical protein AAK882_05090 [Carnobacteriaceae bacterium 52-44]
MLTTIMIEYNSPNFSVSYDPKFDVLRLNNKSVGHFSYEEFEDNLLIMIDDVTNEVIGAQVFNFKKEKYQTINSIQKLNYPNLKKALYKAAEVLNET